MIPERVKIVLDLTIGDGHITKDKSPYCLITHSIKQSEYAAHKAEMFRSYGFKVREKIFESQDTSRNLGKSYHTVYVAADPDITTARKWLYNKNKKALDKSLLDQIDARTLAYWYMDDGSTKLKTYKKDKVKGKMYVYERPRVNAYTLCTDGFTRDECVLLSNLLQEKFNVENNVIRFSTKKDYYRIFIHRLKSKDIFKDLIAPYIFPTMNYKIEHIHSFVNVPFSVVDISQRERLSESTSNLEATVQEGN